ncbi:hypothetical protein AZL_023440 [Azospirillum sp. B510]|nr:hypothetical protein AZL_023440 [Azospirillum sp. B510]
MKESGAPLSEIARATAEQAAGPDEVNIAISRKGEMTQRDAAPAEESLAAPGHWRSRPMRCGNG